MIASEILPALKEDIKREGHKILFKEA